MPSTATLSSFASSGTPRLRARVSPHRAVGGGRTLPLAGRGRVCRASTGDSAGSNAHLSADPTPPVSLERPSEGAAEADRAVPDDAPARHPYESWSVDDDDDAADFSGPSDPAAAPYAPVVSAEPPPPVPASMSPLLNLTFNVGFFSTVILGVLGVRKAARFFASIPDLPEEERLRRMADFCAAQMTRVRDMPEGPARDKELARLEKVQEDIARQRKKFEAAELRRAEWNRRIRRLDETGAPMRSERSSRSPTNGFGSGSAADPVDPVGVSDASAVETERARRLAAEAARARARAEAAEAKDAPPGAAARWVKASEYLESAVEKTASGYSQLESVAEAEAEINGDATEAAAAAADAREGSSEPNQSLDAPGRRSTSTEVPESTASASVVEPPRASKPEPEPEPEPELTPPPAPPPAAAAAASASPPSQARRAKGKIFNPEIVHDGMHDLTNIPGLTPAQEAEVAAEIRRIEQMYGDDRSISAEELDAKCMEVIEKYGLAEKRFTEDEMYDPRNDPDALARHPSEEDPFYWRKLKVVHPVFEARPETETTSILTMMMTHPGLPAYLPGNRKPEDKNHAVAFESREDAERFVWLMRSTRRADEGICTTRPMPPKTLEEMSEESGLGVTVVGAGRVALDPGRSDLEVLAKIREIGGEQYLWEFARFTQRELEESRKPPPPTISY